MRERHQRTSGILSEGVLIIWKIRLRGMAQKVAGKVMETLQNPRIKEQKKSEVKEHARKSVRALLEANRKLVEEQRAKVAETPAHKKARGEELG